MFVNLEEQKDNDIITMSEFINGQKERAYFGICDSDLIDFSSYLDEVILNALESLQDKKYINIPEIYTEEEWRNIIDEMIFLAQSIVANNYIELNESLSKDKLDSIQADSYAYRKELFEMLGEHIVDLYAF